MRVRVFLLYIIYAHLRKSLMQILQFGTKNRQKVFINKEKKIFESSCRTIIARTETSMWWHERPPVGKQRPARTSPPNSDSQAPRGVRHGRWKFLLTEDPHRRIPRIVLTHGEPAPVGHRRDRHPNRHTRRPGHRTARRVRCDEQVEAAITAAVSMSGPVSASRRLPSSVASNLPATRCSGNSPDSVPSAKAPA